MHHRLSEQFHELAEFCKTHTCSLKDLVHKVGARGRALVTLIFSLPFVLFIAPPGLSVVLGIFICFNGVRIATNDELWVPRFLQKHKVKGQKFAKSFHAAEKVAKRLEKLIKPRGRFLARHPQLQIFHGVILAISGFFLALPLPPGTNFLPGLTCTLISLGSLEEDGLFIVLGYIAFALSIAFFVLLPFYGFEFFSEARDVSARTSS